MTDHGTWPDALPTLAAGAHDADDGEACVMEYVAMLAGEEWSDRPECTHPLLAHEARTANDLLPDDERGRLVPLINRLFGTTDDSDEIRARLRLRQARQVLRLIDPSARAAVAPHVERAEQALLGLDVGTLDEAVAVTRDLPRPDLEDADRHARFHLHASRVMAFAWSPDLEPAEAWAVAALAAAHVAASRECRADCADPMSRGLRAVRELGELVDEYEAARAHLTDPQSGEVSERAAAPAATS